MEPPKPGILEPPPTIAGLLPFPRLILDRPGVRTIELGFVIFVFGMLTERLPKPVIWPCMVFEVTRLVFICAMFMLAPAGPDLRMVELFSPTVWLGMLCGCAVTDMTAVTGPFWLG